MLSYDPNTGEFRWLKAPGQRSDLIGSVAGGLGLDGYKKIRVDSTLYQAHRLAWLHHYGVHPNDDIDHINGVKTDNRIENLRDVPHAVNMQNIRRAHRDSSTGLLGVKVVGGRHFAAIKLDGKAISLGGYDTAGEAHAAYVDAKRRLHEGCTL